MLHEILLLLTAAPLLVSPHCNTYGPCRPPSYLPAPPGHVPSCAKPGWTYCENIEHYPGELIRYLIDHWGYNYHRLISDESTQPFNYQEPVTYGPPIIQGYYPTNRTHVYPPRRYKLPAHQQHILEDPAGFLTYSSLNQQRPGVTHYNPNQWWTRYRRSTVAHKRRRRRRQATPPPSSSSADTITLCPTTRQFIMPKAAMNNQGNWMYVVNLSDTDNRYTQLVGTETCTSTQCNGLCSLPTGYTSRCEQQYVQKRLIALEGAGDRLYTDVFWFPHCCICQINPGITG